MQLHHAQIRSYHARTVSPEVSNDEHGARIEVRVTVRSVQGGEGMTSLAPTGVDMARAFLLSEDVAKLLGLSRSTVQEYLSRCLIPHRKMPFTRRCLIPKADFFAWLDGAELETQLLSGGGRI